ncbi:PspC domain-containing protein [Nocardia sienata]|uniref:PspC domain-containing protein n=1 Tax=Nocardia sienata TaxID=248552 RepID=UPI0009FFF10E|nr:PspC domain-containing protein [Nocardia sienata]
MTRTSFGDQLQQMWQTRPVRLPRRGPIAGVAAGFGHRYGIDPVLVRVAFVVSTIFGGAGIVLYLTGWLLFPEPGSRGSMAESLTRKDQESTNQTKTIVLIVALAIAVSTMGPVGIGLGGSGVIALALMLAGWWMLHMRSPEPPPLPPGTVEPESLGTHGTTGYPGAMFPQGGADLYAPPSDVYTPYTRLPDRYIPEPPADVPQPPAHSGGTGSAGDPTQTARPLLAESGDAAPGPTRVTGIERSGGIGASATAASSAPAPDESSPGGSVAPRDPAEVDPAGGRPAADTADFRAARPTVDMSKPGTAEFAHRTPPSWDPLGVAPLAWDLPEPAPARTMVAPAVESRPRSRFTPVVLGLAVLAAAAAGATAVAGSEWMTPGRIGAIALAVIGLGLVFGSFRRRGHGLLLVTAPLAAFVLFAAVIGPVDLQSQTVGDRTWAPASATEIRPEYKVTMGSGTLDLRGIDLTADKTVDVDVQMGQAMVLLPENMNVRTECTVRMGEATCPDGLTGPGGDAPVLNLNVHVRMGDAEVRRG